jgi:D-sedoheptulose 7-phosphate isomerase
MGIPGRNANADPKEMTAEFAQTIKAHLEESARVKLASRDLCTEPLLRAVALVRESLERGGKVMFCGNGGSAADSQHLAAEFTSLLRQDFPRPGLSAIALTTDTSFLTANANDFGFEGAFERLTQAIGRAGDVLVGISTSGNSRNVMRAFEEARKMAIKTVAFTGISGGKMGELADVVIKVPSSKVQHIQETHIAFGHLLCQLVEESLFPNNSQVHS